MKLHVKSVHVDRKHSCEHCRKSFKRSSHLKRHMRAGGRCAAKRQRKEGVADHSDEQPGPSVVTADLLNDSSSESEDVSVFCISNMTK